MCLVIIAGGGIIGYTILAGAGLNSEIDPPMVMVVSHPATGVMYCPVECDNGVAKYYFPVSVHITDIEYKNLKDIPVKLIIAGRYYNGTVSFLYNETKNTDSNGNVMFLVIGLGMTSV